MLEKKEKKNISEKIDTINSKIILLPKTLRVLLMAPIKLYQQIHLSTAICYAAARFILNPNSSKNQNINSVIKRTGVKNFIKESCQNKKASCRII